MRKNRNIFSLLGFCVLSPLVAALVLSLIIAGASVALASHQGAEAQEEPQKALPANPVAPAAGTSGTKFSGMITDSHCGARHMRNTHQTSAECAKACFRKGASYVLVDGDRRYTLIGGEQALASLVGERANVMGTRQGDAIIVDSAAPMF